MTRHIGLSAYEMSQQGLDGDELDKIWFLGRANGIKPARRVMHLHPEAFGNEGLRVIQEDMLLTLGTAQRNA